MQDLESFKGFRAKVLKGPSFCLTKSFSSSAKKLFAFGLCDETISQNGILKSFGPSSLPGEARGTPQEAWIRCLGLVIGSAEAVLQWHVFEYQACVKFLERPVGAVSGRLWLISDVFVMFGSACIGLFCFGVIGNPCDPIRWFMPL